MRTFRKKNIVILAVVIFSLLIICVGFYRIMSNSQTAIEYSRGRDTEINLNNLNELNDNIAGKNVQGRILSCEGDILWSEDYAGYADTFSLVGLYRNGVQLSSNTVCSNYQDVLLFNTDEYSYLKGIKSVYGKTGDIELTLDHELNSKVYSYMKENGVYNGNVLLLDDSGRTIVSVSLPSISPTKHIDIKELENGTLINKNLNGLYFPGSTMKIPTSVVLASLEGENVINKKYNCDGIEILADGSGITCKEHGEKQLYSALGSSCNTYFANVVSKYINNNYEKASGQFENMGFTLGSDTQYDNVDRLTRNKSFSTFNGRENFKSVWSCIGEYSVKVNSYDMCNTVSAIFNEGECNEPYIVEKIRYKDGKIIKHKNQKKQIMEKDAANIVLNEWQKAFDIFYTEDEYNNIIVAKTGTAETEIVKNNGKKTKVDSSVLLGRMIIKNKPVNFFINIEDYKKTKIDAKAVAKFIADNAN